MTEPPSPPATARARGDERPAGRLRDLGKLLFLVLAFTPLLHYNLIEAVPALSLPETAAGERGVARRLYDAVVDAGRRVGLGTVWRMYSPVRRSSIWVRWYAVGPEGPEETGERERFLLPLRDMSPEYQRARGASYRWLWDSRRPILSVQVQLRPKIREDYARYLCRNLPAPLEAAEVSLQAMEFRRRTPPPAARGDFSAFTGPIDETRRLGLYPCAAWM